MTVAEELVIDIFADSFQRDPYDTIRQAREKAPVARDPFGSLILLRIEDFETVATDGRFSAFGDRLAQMLGLAPGPEVARADGHVRVHPSPACDEPLDVMLEQPIIPRIGAFQKHDLSGEIPRRDGGGLTGGRV